MPIEAPSNTPTGSKTHSEFVLCENFAFRPSTVDGCSHQTYQDGAAVTIVNFKSYTQTIPDPQRRLFNFLIRKLKPKPADENFCMIVSVMLFCRLGGRTLHLCLGARGSISQIGNFATTP